MTEQTVENEGNVLRFIYGGDTYELDLDDLSVAETRLIKRRFKVTYSKLIRGLVEADGDSIAAIIYIATNRAGKPVKSDELDDLRPMAFIRDNVFSDNDSKASRDDIQDIQHALDDGDDESDPT